MAYAVNAFTSQFSGIAQPAIGAYNTSGTQLLRVADVDPMFANLNDRQAMFFRLMNLTNKLEAATQAKYSFFEDDEYAIKTTIATYSSSTSIILTDILAVVGSVLWNPRTGDAALVSAASGATCTIERSYQGSTEALWAAGDELFLLGTTLDEGGTAKSGITNLPTLVENYVSFFSNTIRATDLQLATNMINGVGKLDREHEKMTLHVMRQIDQALRHSGAALDAAMAGGTGAAYFTKGLDDYISTNAELPKVGMTWYDLNEAFTASFDYTASSPQKTLLCSSYASSLLTKIAWERFSSPMAFEKELGGMLGTIRLDNGMLIDILVDQYGFPSNGVGTQGYLLDLPFLGVKEMSGFGLTWRDITLPTDHSTIHELYGSASLQVKHGATLHRTVTFA